MVSLAECDAGFTTAFEANGFLALENGDTAVGERFAGSLLPTRADADVRIHVDGTRSPFDMFAVLDAAVVQAVAADGNGGLWIHFSPPLKTTPL